MPAFDQHVVGAPRDADAVLPAEHRPAVYRPQGWLSPVLLVDGVIAGTWRHTCSGDRVAVTIAPFAKQGRAVRSAAEREAVRLADFLGGEPEIAWA